MTCKMLGKNLGARKGLMELGAWISKKGEGVSVHKTTFVWLVKLEVCS